MRAVLERDFLAEVVRPRSFLFRVLVVVAVALVVVAVWSENRWEFRERPDGAARFLFVGGAFALLGLLAVLTPPSVIGSILEERQRETLPLVLAAPIGPTAFAAAKLLARAGAVLAWALAALVPLFALTLFGGVSPESVGTLALLAAGLVLELAAWGVWISSVTRRLATGAILGFLLPALRWGVTLGACAFAVDPPVERVPELPAAWRPALWWAAATTPAPAAGLLGDERDYGRTVQRSLVWSRSAWQGGGPRPPTPPLAAAPLPARHPAAAYLAFSLLAALAGVLLAGRRLAREAEPRASLWERWKRGQRLLRAPPGRGNPIAWKEGRLLNTAASRPLYYTVFVLFVAAEAILLLAMSLGGLRGSEFPEAALGMTSGHACLLGLVACISGAAAMAHERSSGTLDLLRVSPLTHREFLSGKAWGTLRGLGFLLLLPVAHLGVFVACGSLSPPVALLGLPVLALSVLLWTAVGLAAGMACRRTGTAVALAAGLYGALLIGVPLLAIFLGEVAGNRDAAEFLVGLWQPSGTYLTLESFLRLLQPEVRAWHWGPDRPLQDEHHWSLAWSGFLALTAGGLLLASPALLRWRFERERERG